MAPKNATAKHGLNVQDRSKKSARLRELLTEALSLLEPKYTETKIDPLVGTRYNELTIVGFAPSRQESYGTRRVAIVKCSCGNTKEVLLTSLKQGNTTSCGCKRGRKPLPKLKPYELPTVRTNNQPVEEFEFAKPEELEDAATDRVRLNGLEIDLSEEALREHSFQILCDYYRDYAAGRITKAEVMEQQRGDYQPNVLRLRSDPKWHQELRSLLIAGGKDFEKEFDNLIEMYAVDASDDDDEPEIDIT